MMQRPELIDRASVAETVLQVVKFYIVVKKNFKKLTFRTVVL